MPDQILYSITTWLMKLMMSEILADNMEISDQKIGKWQQRISVKMVKKNHQERKFEGKLEQRQCGFKYLKVGKIYIYVINNKHTWLQISFVIPPAETCHITDLSRTFNLKKLL